MTVTAYSSGHPVVWDGSGWRYRDGEPDGSRLCAHCGRAEMLMEVTVLPHPSHTGQQHQAIKGVDACIAGVVCALNDGGVTTTGSCCGHGRNDGSILLADGREIIVRSRDGNGSLSAPYVVGRKFQKPTT